MSVADRIRCVLVRTSLGGNVGASARAMLTMGLHRLSLVAPHNYPHPDATAFAAGAGSVLDSAPVVDTLESALSDTHLVIGATARRRGVALPEWSPRVAASQALAAAMDGREVAFVFGNERTGLENDELKLCHAAVLIPANPDYSSLNLAQAVQVVAYEVRIAMLSSEASLGELAPEIASLPTHAEMETWFDHLAATLDDIDFHKGRSPRTVLRRLRRLFLRAEPDTRELRLLHGILSDAQRMARLARER
ncbi:MAG: RNA methyltransferase [Dokdonella sp.]